MSLITCLHTVRYTYTNISPGLWHRQLKKWTTYSDQWQWKLIQDKPCQVHQNYLHIFLAPHVRVHGWSILTLRKAVGGDGDSCHHARYTNPLTITMIVIAEAVIIQTLGSRCDCVRSDANLTLTSFNSRMTTPFSSTVPFSLLIDAYNLYITIAFSVFVIVRFIQMSWSHFL